MKAKNNRWLACSVLFWLLLWQFAASIANRKLLIPIPTPLTTIDSFIKLACTISFFTSILNSLLRICIGFLGALIAGCILGFLCAKSTILRFLTKPIHVLIRSIPVASFTILLFLWLSRDTVPSSISFFTVFPIIWSNIETGILENDEKLVEMAKIFGMNKSEILVKITVPSIRPYLQSALSTGFGFAWKSGVAAEIICRTQNSLGNLLWAGKTSIDYNEVFAVTLMIVLLSSLLEKIGQAIMSGGVKND